jgi:hypothetical protein
MTVPALILLALLGSLATVGEGGSVKGRIVTCTGGPIPGVTVTTNRGDVQVTGAEGTFLFGSPASGSLAISASLAGFVDVERELCAPSAGVHELEIILPMHVIDLCISEAGRELPKGHRAAGRVLDLRNNPLEIARVRVLREEDKFEMSSMAVGNEGRFVTDELPVGTYILEATCPGFDSADLKIWVSRCTPPCQNDFVLRLSRPCE